MRSPTPLPMPLATMLVLPLFVAAVVCNAGSLVLFLYRRNLHRSPDRPTLRRSLARTEAVLGMCGGLAIVLVVLALITSVFMG